jgi:hypothetical protein
MEGDRSFRATAVKVSFISSSTSFEVLYGLSEKEKKSAKTLNALIFIVCRETCLSHPVTI